MDEIQTLDEIESRYDSQWVLIGEPQIDEFSRLLAGRVLFHSANRDDVHREMLELRLPHFAVRYRGSMPENTVLVL
jgi:hypothetical protein